MSESTEITTPPLLDCLTNPYTDLPDNVPRPDTQMLQARIGMDDYYTMFKTILPRRGTQDNLVATFIHILAEAAKQNPIVKLHYDRGNESAVRIMLERLFVEPATGIDSRTNRKYNPEVVHGCTDLNAPRFTSAPNVGGATKSTHPGVSNIDKQSANASSKVRKGK